MHDGEIFATNDANMSYEILSLAPYFKCRQKLRKLRLFNCLAIYLERLDLIYSFQMENAEKCSRDDKIFKLAIREFV